MKILDKTKKNSSKKERHKWISHSPDFQDVYERRMLTYEKNLYEFQDLNKKLIEFFKN